MRGISVRTSKLLIQIVNEISEELERNREKAITTLIAEYWDILQSSELLNIFYENDVDCFQKKYFAHIEALIRNYFNAYSLSDIDVVKLIDVISRYFFSRSFEYDDTTGVVFSGFGENELFPSTVAYIMDNMPTVMINALVGLEKQYYLKESVFNRFNCV